MHCHRKKLVIIDVKVAFVASIDLTSLGAVADVAEHLAARWHEVTGEWLVPCPPPPPAGEHEVQVIRAGRRRSTTSCRGDFRMLAALPSASASASTARRTPAASAPPKKERKQPGRALAWVCASE
jgi:hypothetical protein